MSSAQYRRLHKMRFEIGSLKLIGNVSGKILSRKILRLKDGNNKKKDSFYAIPAKQNFSSA